MSFGARQACDGHVPARVVGNSSLIGLWNEWSVIRN